MQATIGVALTNNESAASASQSFVTHTVHFLDREWAHCGASGVLETRRFKGRCTAENLVAASRGVAKRYELSKVPRKEFRKVTTVARDEAANTVAAGKLRDEADGWKSQPASQHHTGFRDVKL